MRKANITNPLTATQQFLNYLTTTPSIFYDIYRKGRYKNSKVKRVF